MSNKQKHEKMENLKNIKTPDHREVYQLDIKWKLKFDQESFKWCIVNHLGFGIYSDVNFKKCIEVYENDLK